MFCRMIVDTKRDLTRLLEKCNKGPLFETQCMYVQANTIMFLACEQS